MGIAEDTTFKAIDILKELGVEYAVSGMIAGAVYGHVRVTADVDILVSVDKEKWEEVIRRFLESGFVFRSENFHMLEIATLKTLECFGVVLIVEDDREVFERARELQYHGKTLILVSLEDLIRNKLRFRRGKDLLDLRALLEINASKIDWGYLERKVANPEESDLLERLRRGEEIPWGGIREIPRPPEFCPRR
jgi:hypothetical protein